MTTYATDVYSGTGSQVEFAVTFDFIQRDHVKVYRTDNSDGAETELTQTDTNPTGDEYQWQSNILIEVGTAPTTEQKLRIQRDTPEDEQIVKWADGSYIIADDLNTSDLQWLYGLQELEDKFGLLQTTAIKYLGAIDLTVDEAPAAPEGGDFFINTGAGSVLPSWTGIAGDLVVGSEQVIYNSALSEWEIFEVPSSKIGVVDVEGIAPIVVDDSDSQRPVVSITGATASADGSMSAADKAKLDGISPGATVGIPEAPNDGDQYARQSQTWSAIDIPPETIVSPTPPPNPIESQLWFDSTDGRTYVYYTDTDSSQWVESNPSWNGSIPDGSVTTPKLEDGSVTPEKLDREYLEVGDAVSQIVAGNNVTITPSTGKGVVTINSTGGGGGGPTTPGVRYQQGDWSPGVGSVAGDSTHTYSFQQGNWSRTGNTVTCAFNVSIGALGDNGSIVAGVFNLPYPRVLDKEGGGALTYAKNFTGTGFNPSVIRGISSQTEPGLRFFTYNETDGNSTVGTGRFTAGTAVTGVFTYETDDTTFAPINSAVVTEDIQGTGGGGGGTSTPQKVAILTDVKPDGTHGGASVTGWQDRTLNTIQSDTGNLVTLANDKEFTLKAGTYSIEWSAPAYFVAQHQTKLTNVTAGVTEQLGSSEYSTNDGGATQTTQSRSLGSAYVNITSDTTYKIEHFCNIARSTNGLGIRNPNGANTDCIYTQVTITDLSSGGGGGGGTTVNYNGASAWGNVALTQSDGPCVINGNLNIESVTRNGKGFYDVVFTTPMANDSYSAQATATDARSLTTGIYNQTTTGFRVSTYSITTESVSDIGFSFAVFSENAIAPPSGVGADAWGSFQADGTVDASFNVASITKNETGEYVVEFITPMPTSGYSVQTNSEESQAVFSSCYDKTVNGFTYKCFIRDGATANIPIDKEGSFTVHASSTVTPTYTWTRDGTTLKTANDGDGVDIGSGNILLNADGSGTFLGSSIDLGGSSSFNKINIARPTDGTFKTFIGYDNTVFSQYTQDNNTYGIVNNSGSGIVNIGIPDTGSGNSRGHLAIYNLGTATSTEGPRIKLYGAGDAIFDGAITADNVTFNLEADNVANFSAEGEYTGPMLDVKALLLTLQTAAARIATLEAKVATLESDHTTLMNNNNNNGGGY